MRKTAKEIIHSLKCLCFGLSPLIPFIQKRTVKKYGGKLKFSEYGYKLQVPELVLSHREFDFPVLTNDKSRFYVTSRCENAIHQANLFDWQKLDLTKKLIYCSLGSHPYLYKKTYKKALFQSLIKAVQIRPTLQLVLQISEDDLFQHFQDTNGNIMITKWTPQIEILPRSAIFITHGGLGSVKEAIYFGVPMIVFPRKVDRPGYGARIVYHELGIRGNIAKIDSIRMGNMIDRLLIDETILTSVKKMSAMVQQNAKHRSGVEFIETFIK